MQHLDFKDEYEKAHSQACGEKDDGIRVLVLSGKGKAFCAGANLKEAPLRHELPHLREHMRPYDAMVGLKAFSEKRKPQFKGC